MAAYYNDNDAYCCAWLRNLIAEGLIAPGDVDERSITEVQPSDLDGYTQAHFFAGIGGWSYALRLARWPDDQPVWTGSCPCQPFSAAGKGKAADDERHLWPEWLRLIRACRPPTIFGEQVEAAIGWGWLDLVHSDLEAEGYAVGAAVLPACSVGAPHIRQRLWFVADAESSDGEISISERRQDQAVSQSRGPSGIGELADATLSGECRRGIQGSCEGIGTLPRQETQQRSERCGASSRMAHTMPARRPEASAGTGNGSATGSGGPVALDNSTGPRQIAERQGPEGQARHETRLRVSGDGCSESHWSNLIWLPCTDGKQRPTQPGIFPLAHGIPARVAKLRALGNAIVPQVAAEFIKAAM